MDREAETKVEAASAEASVARYAGRQRCIRQVDFEKGTFLKKLTRDDRRNRCFKHSRDRRHCLVIRQGIQLI